MKTKRSENKMGRAHARVAQALADLEEVFEPQCLLTFIMRDPKSKDCYMVVSADTEAALIETLQLAATTKPRVLSSEEVVSNLLGI